MAFCYCPRWKEHLFTEKELEAAQKVLSDHRWQGRTTNDGFRSANAHQKQIRPTVMCTAIHTCTSWIVIGRTNVEAEALIVWPPDAKSQLTGNGPDAGKDWKQEKGMAEDEVVGWCHGLNGHEFERTPGDGEGQGGLQCCSPWGRKELNTTERLNDKRQSLQWTTSVFIDIKEANDETMQQVT